MPTFCDAVIGYTGSSQANWELTVDASAISAGDLVIAVVCWEVGGAVLVNNVAVSGVFDLQLEDLDSQPVYPGSGFHNFASIWSGIATGNGGGSDTLNVDAVGIIDLVSVALFVLPGAGWSKAWSAGTRGTNNTQLSLAPTWSGAAVSFFGFDDGQPGHTTLWSGATEFQDEPTGGIGATLSAAANLTAGPAPGVVTATSSGTFNRGALVGAAWKSSSVTAVPGAIHVTGSQGSAEVTAHVSVTAVAGALHITGSLGTAEASGNASVTAIAGTIHIAGSTGSAEVTANVAVTAISGAIEVRGSTGSAEATANVAVTAVPGALHITGSIGTAEASGNASVTAIAGTIHITGSTGSAEATAHVSVTAVPGAIGIAGSTGSAEATAHVAVTAVPGEIHITGSLGSAEATAHVAVTAVAGAIHLVGSAVTAAVIAAVLAASDHHTIAVRRRWLSIAAERRYFIAEARRGMSELHWSPKDPDETVDYALDWRRHAVIPAGAEISTSEWDLADTAEGDITLVSSTIGTGDDEGRTFVRISNGTAGTTEHVTNTITLDDGQVLQQTVTLVIAER